MTLFYGGSGFEMGRTAPGLSGDRARDAKPKKARGGSAMRRQALKRAYRRQGHYKSFKAFVHSHELARS